MSLLKLILLPDNPELSNPTPDNPEFDTNTDNTRVEFLLQLADSPSSTDYQ